MKLPLFLAFILVTSFATFLVFRSSPEPDPEIPGQPEQSSLAYPAAILPADPPVKEDTSPPPPPDHNYYSQGRRSYDGTGKYYQGREIAEVMGHQAIVWLERAKREAEEAPAKAIDLITLEPGETLADIGAGSGYYATRIALKHPKAKVIGVDIQPEMIAFLESRAKQLDLTNLSATKGTIQSVGLAPNSIEAALMVDAYHEFSHPYEMMTSLVTALKPGGLVYLLEYRGEDKDLEIKPRHKMTQAQAKKEMKLVGLTWEKTIDSLPWQHFMVFRKP